MIMKDFIDIALGTIKYLNKHQNLGDKYASELENSCFLRSEKNRKIPQLSPLNQLQFDDSAYDTKPYITNGSILYHFEILYYSIKAGCSFC